MVTLARQLVLLEQLARSSALGSELCPHSSHAPPTTPSTTPETTRTSATVARRSASSTSAFGQSGPGQLPSRSFLRCHVTTPNVKPATVSTPPPMASTVGNSGAVDAGGTG